MVGGRITYCEFGHLFADALDKHVVERRLNDGAGAFARISASESVLGCTLEYLRYVAAEVAAIFAAPAIFCKIKLAEPCIDCREKALSNSIGKACERMRHASPGHITIYNRNPGC